MLYRFEELIFFACSHIALFACHAGFVLASARCALAKQAQFVGRRKLPNADAPAAPPTLPWWLPVAAGVNLHAPPPRLGQVLLHQQQTIRIALAAGQGHGGGGGGTAQDQKDLQILRAQGLSQGEGRLLALYFLTWRLVSKKKMKNKPLFCLIKEALDNSALK